MKKVVYSLAETNKLGYNPERLNIELFLTPQKVPYKTHVFKGDLPKPNVHMLLFQWYFYKLDVLDNYCI